jgi:two-component system osmolarity sensor histidine kinase EnvZ
MRPKAIQRALMNLVSNALRYGERRVVSVSAGDRALAFSVEDDGPGIPGRAARRCGAAVPPARQPRATRIAAAAWASAWPSPTTSPSGMAARLRLGDSAALGGLRVDLVLPR